MQIITVIENVKIQSDFQLSHDQLPKKEIHVETRSNMTSVFMYYTDTLL
jgi:hypothetical protein